MLTDIFNALIKEAQFTKEMLGAGATQIRRANYASKGVYFQAFTSLSTGIERIGKLCLILDHFINHEGKFPDDNDMRAMGHKIGKIYTKSQSVIVDNSIAMKYLSNLNAPIHQAILKVLDEFATGDRYSNINLIVNAERQGDPIASWSQKVNELIYSMYIPEKKRNKIHEDAAKLQKAYHIVYIMFSSETNEPINNIEELSYQHAMFETISPYRQFYVLQTIRYWVELLVGLQYKAMSTDTHYDIPYFDEIFLCFNVRDQWLKRRKKWDNLNW